MKSGPGLPLRVGNLTEKLVMVLGIQRNHWGDWQPTEARPEATSPPMVNVAVWRGSANKEYTDRYAGTGLGPIKYVDYYATVRQPSDVRAIVCCAKGQAYGDAPAIKETEFCFERFQKV
jgi:hypothetical protein